MPTYMGSTKNGYRFRRPIPKDLVHLFDKENFVERLGKDYKKAKIRCAELTVETDRALTTARSSQAQTNSIDSFLKLPRETRLKRLSVSPELPGQIALLWLSSLEADALARRQGMDDEEFESRNANIKEVQPLINRALASGNVDRFHEAVNQLIQFRGYQLEATNAQWQELTYEVLKHFQAGYKIFAARQQGESLGAPDLSELSPPLLAPWENQTQLATPQVKRLADITKHYEDFLTSSAPKDRSTYLSIWKRFVEFTGNKPLSLVGSADIYDFFQARLNAADAPWSNKYVSGRVRRVLHTVFGLAKTKQLIATNPVADLDVLPKISPKEESLRAKPRFPYQSHHLNTLFASDWYKPDSSQWRGKMKDDLGARYWIPLICMWHGLRVTEAAQLQTQDVDLERSCLNISNSANEIGPERSLKNDATKRVVPIHPVLLEQGFNEFVLMVKEHYAHGPLFPAALPEPKGKSPKWGRAYEQPFLRFIRDKLNLGNGYGNHSFRHALEDRIRAANVPKPWPEGLARAYTGRSSVRQGDKGAIRVEGSEAHYGDGYEIDAIRLYIEQITFVDVNLPLPFEEWLNGKEAISKRLFTFAQKWKNVPA